MTTATTPTTPSRRNHYSLHHQVCACGATANGDAVWLQGRCPACHAATGIVAPRLRPDPHRPVRFTSTEAERHATACTGAYAPWHRPLGEWMAETFDDAEAAA